jgi:osmoprotectant transport system permease protein
VNASQWHALGVHGAEHLLLVLVSLIAAFVIALPLGIAFAESRRAQTLLAVLNMFYTLPSLALFALLVPVLGLGMQTAVAVLTLYGATFLTRSITLALRALPSQVRENAVALGTTREERLLRIELPLAAPAIVSGLRTTCIMLIATAGIAAWIDAGGLGVLLFEGLRQDDNQRVLEGSTALAFMALCFDGALSALERFARRRTGLM